MIGLFYISNSPGLSPAESLVNTKAQGHGVSQSFLLKLRHKGRRARLIGYPENTEFSRDTGEE